MTTPSKALEKVRELATYYAEQKHCDWDGQCIEHGGKAKSILALIPIIVGAMLPELPEGWWIHELSKGSIMYPDLWFCRLTTFHVANGNELYGEGPTPNAAVLAAKEKVKQ